MLRRNRGLIRNIGLYLILALLIIGGFGVLEQHEIGKVHWFVLYMQFTLFVLLICSPLWVLAIWLSERQRDGMERALQESSMRLLPILAHLFTEQWQQEREAGTLPGTAQHTTVTTTTTVTADGQKGNKEDTHA